MAKQSVTLEVLSYHASASLEDAQRLRVSPATFKLEILQIEQNLNFLLFFAGNSKITFR